MIFVFIPWKRNIWITWSEFSRGADKRVGLFWGVIYVSNVQTTIILQFGDLPAGNLQLDFLSVVDKKHGFHWCWENQLHLRFVCIHGHTILRSVHWILRNSGIVLKIGLWVLTDTELTPDMLWFIFQEPLLQSRHGGFVCSFCQRSMTWLISDGMF